MTTKGCQATGPAPYWCKESKEEEERCMATKGYQATGPATYWCQENKEEERCMTAKGYQATGPATYWSTWFAVPQHGACPAYRQHGHA